DYVLSPLHLALFSVPLLLGTLFTPSVIVATRMLKRILAKAFRSCHCVWSTAVIRSSRAQRAVAPGLYHTRPTDNCVWIARKLIQFMNEPVEFSARSEACRQNSIGNVFHRERSHKFSPHPT